MARHLHARSLPPPALRLFLGLALLLALATAALPTPSAAAPAGTLDATFDPGTGPNGAVYATMVQPDGKVLIAGAFTNVGGTARNRIARLNADGSLDSAFNPGTGANGDVLALALQSDGKVLIGGNFTSVNGTTRSYVARLNANGSLDTTFTPSTLVDGTVRAVAVNAAGQVIIGGDFTATLSFNNRRNYLARLSATGTLDTAFNTGTTLDDTVRAIAVEPDGQVLAGGDFTTPRNRIARFNTDGSNDTTFNPGTAANGVVRAVALQSDGQVLIGGDFTSVAGTTRNRVARLGAAGTLDSAFNPNAGGAVQALAVQADGKILFGGDFTSVGGTARNRIARVNADGSLDSAFTPGTGAGATVNAVAVQADGKVLIGGSFTAVNGTTRNRVARLLGTATVPEIGLSGNGQAIADGDTTPAAADGTDFGGVAVGASATRTFTIANSGDEALNLAGATPVTLAGANAADFSVVAQPTTPIAPGGSATFEVRFAPGAEGARAATLSIASDDADENPYDVALAGSGLVPGYASNPAPGATVQLGNVAVGATASADIEVSESGDATLQVTGHTLAGAGAADFAVTPATLSIADGGAPQSLTVSCTPSVAGLRSATLTVAHNAAGSPATYSLECTGVTAPAFSSALPAAGAYGTPYTHTFVATGSPAASLSLSGTLPPGLSFDAATGTLSGTPTAAGSYAEITVTAANGVAPNAVQSFTLTIAKAQLEARAADQLRRVGQENGPLTVLYSGFVNGDSAASLDTPPTASTTADAASPAGTYEITVSGGSDDNYSFTYVAGTLTVTNKDVPVIAWARPAAITYGTALGASQLNATASFGDEPVAGVFTYTPAAGTVLNAGTGRVLAVTFTPSDTQRFSTATAQVQIDVLPAPLTVTAEDKAMVAGEALPPLTARYSGFVNGDSVASLDTPVTLSTAATSASPAGRYAIVASGAADANYTISFVNGTLTVRSEPASTTIYVYLPLVKR